MGLLASISHSRPAAFQASHSSTIVAQRCSAEVALPSNTLALRSFHMSHVTRITPASNVFLSCLRTDFRTEHHQEERSSDGTEQERLSRSRILVQTCFVKGQSWKMWEQDSPSFAQRYQCLRVCRGKNLLSVSGWKKPSANLPLRETSFSSFGSASPAEIVSVAAEHAGECMEKSRGTRMMKVRSMVNEEDKNEECDFAIYI
uniref:Uncharacterized protein n=2 Tax=Oryza rufipogon TaxID=4529 RepID=A0A0E0PHZ5_ORYRU